MSITLRKYICVFLGVWNAITVKAGEDSQKIEDASSLYSSRRCEDGWDRYKDEKCIKILDYTPVQQLNYAEAKAYCKEHYEANLVSIDNQYKQRFLERYLRFKGVLLNVWIGLEHKMNGVYQWSDGTRFTYQNWAPGSPKNKSDHCVQIQVDNDKFGKWSDALCTVKNVVLCERIQLWSSYRLQKMLMNIVSDQMLPIGFIFFHLSKQKPPTEIWPLLTWKDVTAEYAGVFFRALGGESGSFGSVQEGYAPRLTSVLVKSFGKWGDSFNATYTWVFKGGCSNWLYTSTWPVLAAIDYRGLAFYHEKGEVRPRNMAIRVWKRV